MADVLAIFLETLITNPLTVTLVILGVLVIVLSIIGKVPPIELTRDSARRLMTLGVTLVVSGIVLAFLLAWVTAPPPPTPTPTQTEASLPPTPPPTQPPVPTSTDTPVPPSPTETFTPSPVPTDTPPPTASATFTPPPTDTPTPKPTAQPFYIISPRDEASFGCSPQGGCLVTVRVQWVPPSLSGQRRLYVLVNPRPGEGFPYYVQPVPTHTDNGIWVAESVGIGYDNPPGTHFWVCAVVTTDSVPAEAQLSQPPSGSLTCVDVYR